MNRNVALLVGVALAVIGCEKPGRSGRPVEMSQYHGHTRDAVVRALGEPHSSDRFTMADVGDEMRIELRNTYPPSDPASASVPIEELRWQDGDYWIYLWLHEVNGQWVVLDSLRWHKDVRF